MAGRYVRTQGSATSKTSSGTLGVTWASGLAPAIGSILICPVAEDPSAASSGNPGVPSGGGVSLWTQLGQAVIGGSAGAGVQTSLWAGLVDGAGATSLTVTFAASITAKAAGVLELAAIRSPSVVTRTTAVETRDTYGAVTNNTGSPSLTLPAVGAGDIAIVMFGYEAAFAAASYGMPVAWTEAFETGTTGGNGNTNISLHAAIRVGPVTAGAVTPTAPAGSYAGIGAIIRARGSGPGLTG